MDGNLPKLATPLLLGSAPSENALGFYVGTHEATLSKSVRPQSF